MSFKTRIEDYLGTTFSDTDALDAWLTSEGKKLVDLVPLNKAEKYVTSVTDAGSGAGASIADYRVISAHKSGIGAKRINASEYSRVSNTNSIYYADANSPMFYINSNRGFILPGGGTFLAISKGSIANSDSAFVVPELTEGLVIATALRCIYNKIATAVATINGLSISGVTVPSAPSVPVFSYDAVTVSPNTAYTEATYTNALTEVMLNANIESLASAPVYTKITSPTIDFTNANAFINTDEDVELANAELGQIKTKLENFQMEMYNELNEFNSQSLEYNAELQKKLKQAELLQQRLIAESNAQIELNKFNAQQNSNLEVINRSKELESDVFNKSKEIEIAIINKTKELERQISEYASSLQRYQSEIQQYSSEINAKVADAQKSTMEVQGYIPLIQSLKAEYNEIIQSFINN